MTLGDSRPPGGEYAGPKRLEVVPTGTANGTDPLSWRPESPAVGLRGGTESWVERTERALDAAKSAGTHEAWEEAARTAAVVADIAKTMEIATGARKRLEQRERDALEAAIQARLAAQTAAVAKETVGQLEDIVVRAQNSNTPQAWSEALENAAATSTALDDVAASGRGRQVGDELIRRADFEETIHRR